MEPTKKSIRVAIHQPNFFPWLGYFDKISRSDVFVFMDDVSYPKSGNSTGTWINRVKIMVQGKSLWVGCPIIREHGNQIIKDVNINDTIDWKKKLLNTIWFNYKKALYFYEANKWIEEVISYECKNLASFNINVIKSICSKLGIERQFINHSSLSIDMNVKATDLLIEIVKAVGGDSYICGGGASGYQEDDKFAMNDITLIYQNFIHPRYTQVKTTEFCSGLSIIDTLMNCGFKKTGEFLGSK